MQTLVFTMRVLLGGYGFLGAVIGRSFADAGFAVTAVRRSAAAPAADGGIRFLGLDLITETPDFGPDVFDIAIFCLAPGKRGVGLYEQTYITAQRHFLAGMKCRKYVYISSTAVYPHAPETYDEEAASSHSEKAGILLEAESLALAQPKSAVLRLAGLYCRLRPIYGNKERDASYSDDKLVHFIHRDDAARAVIHAVEKNLSGVYNVHDGNPQRRSAILRHFAYESPSSDKFEARHISTEKFFNTAFHPLHNDYFTGLSV